MERSRSSRDRERGKEGEKHGDRDNDKPHDSYRGKCREREWGGEESKRERSSKNPTRDHHRRHLEKLMEHPVCVTCVRALVRVL